MRECAQCSDYLDIPDFEEDHVCPICFKYAVKKRDAAIFILKRVLILSKDHDLNAEILKVLEMRYY